ncbi:MAG: GHMP kinase [Chloroflexota bacterium]|nr:GHMP kinase [Chloroflexota bacterium]MDE2899310.1 GHMP kinase [Chloroflexota bacterium]
MTRPAEPCQTANLVGRGAAWAPGTCGELAQGHLDGTAVMVTCPIDVGSRAVVEVSHGSGSVHGPASAPKAGRAVASTLDLLGRPDLNARLDLESALPRSKGMASSTADVSAAIAATAAALDATLSPQQQAELALAVEPSDGVMLPGIALFDHLGGRIARTLGQPPPMRVLVLEFAGEVDTEAFNAGNRANGVYHDDGHFREALELIAAGLANGDPRQIGEGATLSSQLNQSVLPKPQLSDALKLGQDAGALGVNVAHSGTVIGLLFEADAELIAWAAHSARQRLPEIVAIHNCRMIGGGAVVHPGTQRTVAPTA